MQIKGVFPLDSSCVLCQKDNGTLCSCEVSPWALLHMNSEIQFMSRNNTLRRWCIWIVSASKLHMQGARENGCSPAMGSVLADLLGLISVVEPLLWLRRLGKQGRHCAAQRLKPLTTQWSVLCRSSSLVS